MAREAARPRCFCQVESAPSPAGFLVCTRARCSYKIRSQGAPASTSPACATPATPAPSLADYQRQQAAAWRQAGAGAEPGIPAAASQGSVRSTPSPARRRCGRGNGALGGAMGRRDDGDFTSPVTYRQAYGGGGAVELEEEVEEVEKWEDPEPTEEQEPKEEPDPEPAKPKCQCPEGLDAAARVSRTSRNPNRPFWGCSKPKGTGCSYFEWEDERQAKAKRPRSASGGDAGLGGSASKRPRSGGLRRMLLFLYDIESLAAVVSPREELPPGFEGELLRIRGVRLQDIVPTAATLDGAAKRVVLPILQVGNVQRVAAAAGVTVDLGVPKSVLATLTAYVEKEERRARERKAVTAGLDGILPMKMCEKLMEFQWDGIHFALSRDGRALIGDDMGLGKTLQAIAVARVYRSDWPLLIVCPSSLRLNWKEELLNWLGEDIDEEEINVVMKGADCARKLRLVNIVSYDLCQKIPPRQLSKCHFIVCDESHYLKTRDTKRSKFVLPLVKNARRALLLSGTPALSRPVELFPQVNAIEPVLFPNYSAFTERYCNAYVGRWGMDVSGAANLDELHKILNGSLLIRRKKEDVLTQLPSKQRAVVWVETKASVMKEVRAAQMELEVATAAMENAQSEEDALMCRNAQRSANNKLYTLTGDAKVDAVQVYVKEALESTNGKLLVFGHHKEVLATVDTYVRTKLKTKTIVIDGNTNQAHRQGLCTKFQNDDSVRIAMLSITAAGVGLTLTAASVVIFAELYWNPGSLLQAEDRAHRIGQKDCVMIKYLLARDTLDEGMWSTVKKKLQVVGKSLTGQAAQMAVAANPTRQVDDGSNDRIDQYMNGRNAVSKMIGDHDGDSDGVVLSSERRLRGAGRRDAFAAAGANQCLEMTHGGAPQSERESDDLICLDSDDEVFPVDLTPPRRSADGAHPVVHFDADLAYARRLQAEFDAEAGN